MSGLLSRFDWYSATFEQLDDGRVPDAFAVALGGTITTGKGNLGYTRRSAIERDDKLLAQVFTGSPRPGEVHVVVSGDSCDRVVPFVRRMWPDHRVSRADSAIDFRADFPDVDSRALAFAQDRGLSHRLFTDSDGGATRYLGSASSEMMVRVYKKSEELRKKHPDQAGEVPDGIVRAEVVARPNSRMKGAIAYMSPDEIWGLGRWSRDFASMFLDLEVERVSTHFRESSDWSRSLHWMGRQYGPLVRARAEAVGRERAVSELLETLGVGHGA